MRILGCVLFLAAACSHAKPAPQQPAPAPAPAAFEEPAPEAKDFNDAPTATTQAECGNPAGCLAPEATAAPVAPPCDNPEGCVLHKQ